MKTDFSTGFYISGQELNDILIHVIQDYNALNHNHRLDLVHVDFNSNVSTNEIKNYFIRRHRVDLLRILYRYFNKNKLIKRYKYQYGTEEYEEIKQHILFKYDEISKHFNINIRPQFKYHDETSFRYISYRLKHHILDFISNHLDILPTNQLNLLHTAIYYADSREYNDEYDRHFDLTSEGKLTYLARKKLTIITRNDKWAAKSRTQIKFAKGLRKIVGYNSQYISDQIFETFHNYIYSKFHFNDTFEILTGLDIADGYHGGNYAQGSGSLNGSCMRYSECQSYLDIYTDNPQISLLVSKNTGDKITGRALLMQTTMNDKPVTIMDRIYGQDKTIQAFKDYATKHNMLYKQEQNYHNHVLVAPNGSLVRDVIRIKLDKAKFSQYPYMDTFKFVDFDNKVLSNLAIETSNIKCESTQGSWQTIDEYYDDDDYVTLGNGDRIPEDQAGYCNHLDEWHHIDDCHWSDEHQTYIHCEHGVYIESVDDYYHEDDDIGYDEMRGVYDLIENLTYSNYDECYYSDYEECIVYGPVHLESVKQIVLENGTEYYIHNDVTINDLRSLDLLTTPDVEYLINTNQIN